jgi:putative flippase GtrA
VIARFFMFSAAGSIGFAIQIVLVAALTHFGVHYLIATVLATELAILANFAWHERWTWADRPSTLEMERWRRLARFNALTGVTSILGSTAIVAMLVEIARIPPLEANIVSIVLLGFINFAGANALVFRGAVTIVMLTAAASASASDEAVLQAHTIRDFEKYVAAVEARSAREVANHEPFLDIERLPPAQLAPSMAALKRGEVIVTRGAARDASSNEIAIDGGLINHWRGTVFVPNVTLDQLLKVLQEPQTDKHKQEDVLSSRVISRDGDSQKVYLRLRRTKFVTVVYDTEYDVEYKRLAPDRALSNSISTKVVEIENAGTPKERALPEGNDHGYMWRLNSYWRYKQQDGGVIVEIESVTLSRDLPAIIGPLIRPIVNSTARESMSRTLASVRARFTN